MDAPSRRMTEAQLSLQVMQERSHLRRRRSFLAEQRIEMRCGRGVGNLGRPSGTPYALGFQGGIDQKCTLSSVRVTGMKVGAFIAFISGQMLFKRQHRVGLRARGS